jgi:hypothetical protein
MTLNVHRRRDQKRCFRTRVWLNGVEVSSRCFYADGRRGVVRLYRHNAEGHKYIEDDHAATEERRGHVYFGRKAA